jgi:type II restriction enzyme
MIDKKTAKAALDKIITKSRVHLYKPIQIAEILYRHRTMPDTIDLLKKESYRIKSRKWRDDISVVLLGSKSTSSIKFQDNLFDDNAIPPDILNILGEENIKTNGAVEAYIYNCFETKHIQLSKALSYCLNSKKDDFNIATLINSFRGEAGLKRSIDKIYEIIVYALFSTLVEALELQIEISINQTKQALLSEFSDFAEMIMCLDINNAKNTQNAKVFRVGVTNAADRGLDMYSNWGPAIQIKHLSLSEELAEAIVDGVSSDKIVIVCKEAEEKIIVSLLNQIGWRNRIQSIVTEKNLIDWYEKALRGKYADKIGDELLACLCEEISNEFPSLEETPERLKGRGYDEIHDDFWSL